MTYTRKCDRCDNIIEYTNSGSFYRAKRKNTLCSFCFKTNRKTNKIQKIFTRKCPKCNIVLEYKSYHSHWWSIKHNLLCRSCSKIGKSMPAGFSEKLSTIFSGKDNPMYGKKHTDKTKEIISVKNKGNKSRTGKPHNLQSIEKQRISAANRIKQYGSKSRNFNKSACDFIDEYNKINNIKLIHALNGGEYSYKGFFADGYDATNNIWFEYDEPTHYSIDRISLKDKDIKRMNIIKEGLKCKFIRYNERLKTIKEY